MTEKKSPFYSQVKQLGLLTVIPILLLAGPAVGFMMGGWLDRKFHIYPWMTILFLILGFIAAGREITRLLKQILKEENKTQ